MPEQSQSPGNNISVNIWLQCEELKFPPINDALVLGKTAPITAEAMGRALTLLHVSPFEHVELSGEYEDDVVNDIFVRRNLLHKIPREKLIPFLVQRVKAFMTTDEILHLRIDAEVSLKDQI